MKTYLGIFAILISQSLHAMTVDEAVRIGGRQGGLVVFPDGADPALAVAFAKQPNFIVYVQSSDEKALDEIRSAARAAQALNVKLFAVAGAPDIIQLADRMACLIIADQMLPSVKEEWTRVLAPGRGVAIVGGKKAFTRPLEPGLDPWTHRYHAADQVLASNDETVKPPFMTQWQALPIFDGYWGSTAVSAHGRLYFFGASRVANESLSLRARGLHNGIQLWERSYGGEKSITGKLAAGFYPGRSCMIAHGDSLYLMEVMRIVELDGETGKEIRAIAGPDPEGQLKWMALDGDRLAVLSGAKDEYRTTALQQECLNKFGRLLAVYDFTSGKERWRETLPSDADDNMLAIRNGRIFVYVKNHSVRCYDLNSGKSLWANTDPQVLKRLETVSKYGVDSLLPSQCGLRAADEAVVIGGHWIQGYVMLNPDDGQLLWVLDVDKRFGRSLRELVSHGKIYSDTGIYNVRTGEKLVNEFRVPGDGCGPSMIVGDTFITGFGGAQDAESGKDRRNRDIKPACDIGAIVSESTVFTGGGMCRCNMPLQGYRAFAPVDVNPRTLTHRPDALKSFSDKVTPLKADVKDWLTYRHDMRHSGATAASIGDAPQAAWTFETPIPQSFDLPVDGFNRRSQIHPDLFSTPPVCADGKVWFVDPAGILHGAAADSGKDLWTISMDAHVFSPPTLADGRLLVGGGDGTLYALDAATGKKLWQFDGAPMDRRIFWFGHLISTWPITGSPVVKDGLVFFVAGYHNENGIHAYALDVETGKLKWDSHGKGGDINDAVNAWYSAGQIAAAGDRLWISSKSIIPGSFALEEGEPGPHAGGSGVRQGQFMGVLNDDWLIYGGERLLFTQEFWNQAAKSIGYTVRPTKLVDWEQYNFVDLISPSRINPVWDEKQFFAVRDNNKSLGAWTVSGVMQQVNAALEKPIKRRNKRLQPVIGTRTKETSRLDSQLDHPQWEQPNLFVIAMVLTPEHLVLTQGTTEDPGARHKTYTGWHLTALDRQTGLEVWTQPLPVQPVTDGLAIDRDGRVYVNMRDGSVGCFTTY